MTLDPVRFDWTGEAMVPATRLQGKIADKLFTVGESYLLIEHDETTQGARAFFFVNLTKIWKTLPENLERQFPSVDRMRYLGLIKFGHCDHDSFVCASQKQAEKFAAFLARTEQANVLIQFDGAVVHKFTAHSMKGKAMSAKTFRAAADKILDWASDLVGTTKEQIPESDA